MKLLILFSITIFCVALNKVKSHLRPINLYDKIQEIKPSSQHIQFDNTIFINKIDEIDEMNIKNIKNFSGCMKDYVFNYQLDPLYHFEDVLDGVDGNISEICNGTFFIPKK